MCVWLQLVHMTLIHSRIIYKYASRFSYSYKRSSFQYPVRILKSKRLILHYDLDRHIYLQGKNRHARIKILHTQFHPLQHINYFDKEFKLKKTIVQFMVYEIRQHYYE